MALQEKASLVQAPSTSMDASPASSSMGIANPAWYRALTLAERLDRQLSRSARRLDARDVPESARRRLRAWKSLAPFVDGSEFAQRLTMDGLTEGDLLSLLSESAESLRDRVAVPADWLVVLDRLFAPDAPGEDPTPPSLEELRGRETTGFLVAIEPMLREGKARLRRGIEAIARSRSDRPFAPDTIEDVLFRELPERLASRMSRTMILELNVARLEGLLQGETTEERFRSFLQRLCRREHTIALWSEYPVLARELWTCIDNWVTVSLEFLERLSADWDAIRAEIFAGEDPGVLEHVHDGGDHHAGGRTVQVLRFSSGARLIYKPRSLSVEYHFQDLLRWLNDRGATPHLRPLGMVDRQEYGWAEFVDAHSCTSEEDVRRFYTRLGGYLAVLYGLEAVDFHCENVIAMGEHPMPIDVEALFQPRPERMNPQFNVVSGGKTLADSVLRIGLLPHRIWSDGENEGVDVSGLGVTAGQLTPYAVGFMEGGGTDEMRYARKRVALGEYSSRPKLNGEDTDPLNFADAIEEGFTSLYRLMLEHRQELLADDGPVARFRDDVVRVILRPSQMYALLLNESFHPDLLRNALDRDRYLDRLWMGVEMVPYYARLIPLRAQGAGERRGADVQHSTGLTGHLDLCGGSPSRVPQPDEHGAGPGAAGEPL